MNSIRKTYQWIGRVPSMLYEPELPGDKAKICIILMHAESNYFEFHPALALSERGYRVLVANNSDPTKPLDHGIEDLAAAVKWAKEYPGVEKLVLLGHSGGATLVSAYESIAENGLQIFQGPEKIIAISDVGWCVAADAVMFLDSNLGNGCMSLLSLDPAIIDERNGQLRDPELDMFLPANGFDPEGCHYSESFIRKFLEAQSDRMERLIRHCQERVDRIDRGKGYFADDEPLALPGASQIGPNNKMFPQLPETFSHTAEAWNVIHPDGSMSRQIVPCLRKFRPGINSGSQLNFGGLVTTVKGFLRSSAVHSDRDLLGYDESFIYGVDWDSSYCVTTGNVAGIHVPMLIMGMTGSYEYIAAEHIYRRAVRCTDKTMAFVEGASHNFVPQKNIEAYPGEFGDTVKNCFDYADRWLTAKFQL